MELNLLIEHIESRFLSNMNKMVDATPQSTFIHQINQRDVLCHKTYAFLPKLSVPAKTKILILKWKMESSNWQIEFRIAPTVISYFDALRRMQPNQRAYYSGRCDHLDGTPPYSLSYQKYKPQFFALDKQFG